MQQLLKSLNGDKYANGNNDALISSSFAELLVRVLEKTHFANRLFVFSPEAWRFIFTADRKKDQ